MNPYVYSRSRKGRKGAVKVSAGELVKSIIGASVSPVLAFALVLFAAGSLGSITTLAYSEMTQPVAMALPPVVGYSARSEVLGASTTAPVEAIIQDSQLEAGVVSGKISVKPLSYDSTLGRWNYAITYTISSGFMGTGTLSIGSYPLVKGITASGSATTASILKPRKVYNITLWLNDQNDNPISAIRYQFKTAKATTSSSPSQGQNLGQQCAPPPIATASSTALAMPNFCIKKDDGTSQCAPVACMPPMRLRDFNSSSTPPYGSATSTPPGQQMYRMPPNSFASGTPPGFPPPPYSGSSTPANLSPPPK